MSMARRLPVCIKAVRYALLAVLALMFIDCENTAIQRERQRGL